MNKLTKLFLCLATGFGSVVTKHAVAQDAGDTTQSTLTRYGQELELLKRIKVSGYIQGQFQYADSSGQQSFSGGNFPAGVDKRFALRRARVKFQYDSQLNSKGWSTSQYVFQMDMSEKGFSIKDCYIKLTDPWSGWFSLTTGMQNRPFGYEIGYSSSMRESPERGRLSQIIFPGERDLGAMITVQGPKTGNWNWLKLEAGMFNGTGARSAGADASDFDKFKDFIGHISATRSAMQEKIKWGLGASYYYGGYRIDTVNVYKMGKDSAGLAAFVIDRKKADNKLDSISARSEAMRVYMGVDFQFSIDWLPGITTVRGEYIQGEQPGSSSSTQSPATVNASDIYKRNFNGAYFYFLQNILQTPWQAIVKYDWYDPNTDVEGDEIGKKTTSDTKKLSATDLKYTTLGFGLAYRWDANVKITLYYDLVKNETSENLSGYTKDLTDNVITARIQVKF